MICWHRGAANVWARVAVGFTCVFLLSMVTFVDTTSAQTPPTRPGILFSTLFGGANSTSFIAVTTDRSGNTYLVAETTSPDFPVTTGSYDVTYNGQEDAAVVKMDAAGRLVYSTYVGGPGTEHPIGIAVDDAGNVYVTGYTASPTFPMTGGTANGDAFIFKLNATGSSLVYSTRFGGAQLDEPTSVAVANGVAFVAGITYSSDFPTTSGAFSRTYSGGYYPDGFLASFAPDGTFFTGTYFGGNAEEDVMGIALDSSGAPYVTGDTRSDNFPTTPGAWRQTRSVAAGGAEPFVMKFTAAGSLVYSTFLGGAGIAAGIAVDGSGRAVAVGRAFVGLSPFSTSSGAPQPTGRGPTDAYVVKLDATGGTRIFSTLLGGSQDEYVRSVALDKDANVWVGGSTTSPDFPTTPGAVDRSLDTNIAAQPTYGFIGRIAADGSAITYGSFIGCREGSWTYTYAVAVDSAGVVNVAGTTNGTDFPVTGDAVQHELRGNTNGFFTRINPVPVPVGEVVLHAIGLDRSALHGRWTTTADPTAADGTTLWIPDAGVSYTEAPLAAPSDYVDVTFVAAADTPYTVWLRLKAQNDNKYNDSVWAQFGRARIGPALTYAMWTTSGLLINLEQNQGYGESGWGWQHTSYWLQQPATVQFSYGGVQTLRIQVREDGVMVDQIIVSPARYLSSAPGAPRADTTIVPTDTTAPPPPPPPPSDTSSTLLSRGRPARASSVESASLAPNLAVDGNGATRWSSVFADSQWIDVDLGGMYDIDRVVLAWEAAYAAQYQIQISNDGVLWQTVRSVTSSGGKEDIGGLAATGRYVRIYASRRATQWGVSLWEMEVYGTPARLSANLALTAQNRTASSVENASLSPSNATDGKTETRWSSTFADNQWISVDLGATTALRRTVLRWEAAYASSYAVQASDDGVNWRTLFDNPGGDGGVDDVSVAGSGRYVRVLCGRRATSWGVSLWEFEVYGAQ